MAPVRMRCRAVEKEAQPPTITGRSNSGDKALEVERLGPSRDVLGGHHCPLDDQDVETGLDRHGGVLSDTLRCETGRGGDPTGLHLLDALTDQVRLDGLEVDLLHPPRGLLGRKRSDFLERGCRILVPGPQPLKVEHPETAKFPDCHRGLRTHRRIHGRGQHRDDELVSVDLPGDVDIVGVAGAPARDDGDVVEPPGAAPGLADADLYFHGGLLGVFCAGG